MATVMVNGLPGPMATAVALEVVKRNLQLAPMSLCGPSRSGTVNVESVVVQLCPPNEHDKAMEDARAKYTDLVVVDCTQPHVCTDNTRLYAKHKVDFVMVATGGDVAEMQRLVKDAGLRAVIAPNMCKAIVALQSMLQHMGEKYPNALSGFKLNLTESHQATKKDTSGTARAMVGNFNKLGVPFSVEDIKQIRDEEQSKALGVPETALNGHAFHTYDLQNESVQLQFQHNVVGRHSYAQGTVDAVLFLMKQTPGVYNMINVLESGMIS
uniref:4-hydroxy-tetrahydrodipicolinate reductase n=1 Tax=Hematodinium sp. SG-2015 TaxID=1649283 RepID=A0A0F7EVT8_9DINO|nr:DapB [Hematodinium sp. SG-2015]|eukprot:GEMP01039472.1.p1 GENE.GEMP01039472.1~~GEMP01039472.1.p1  ORF type:complete len:283 (-),score=55.52 GEMP01039472.1:1079-1882(-)